MKQTTFQHPELRDANDNIIQQGAFGKNTALANSTNDGWIDYVANDLEALYNNINGSRIYVANKAALPATGDLSAMYIAEDTGKWYLWDGTKYIETDNARKIADEAIAARDAAKASQTAAKTSEQNAKASETDAASSASAAAGSAGAAKTSEQNAGTQASTAKAWATSTTSPDGAADTSSTTGKTQSAKSWAMYSKDRATASASSASAAAGSASAAKTSENNAASSKSAAATSATNAANSAKAAADSATAAANSAKEQQADWNVTDTTNQAFIKNKPTGFSVLYEVNLSELSRDNFYPVVFPHSPLMLRCEIHSQSATQTSKYNQNALSFRLLKEGWTDTPYSFFVETYNVYDTSEITIGCVGTGQNQGNICVWLRGGLQYRIISNRKPSLFPSGFTEQNEKFTVGQKYYGSDDNLRTMVLFTPQVSVKSGPWYDGLFSGIFEKAVCDAAGNNIQETYAKKSDLSSSLSTTSLTVSGETSVPTANAGNSSKAIANTEFVAKSIASLVNGAPDQLNTLNELAEALGNDANFSATITAELAKKLNSTEAESTYLPLSGGTMTGNTLITMGNGESYVRNWGNGLYLGGTNSDNASRLVLFTNSNANGFQLEAGDGTTFKRLYGNPDGTLTWDGQPLLPVGVVQAFAGTTIPNGWLLCDGSAVSRTDYAALYAVIGTAYGAGNGSTTFNLPNLVDKFIEGSATSGTEKSAGLPNIEGRFVLHGEETPSIISRTPDPANAFYGEGGSETQYRTPSDLTVRNGAGSYGQIHFSASRHNSVYGNSITVQPPALTMRYIIKY